MTPELSSLDERSMQHALDLAKQSVGLSSPNPAVGSVVVRDDRVQGEGFHEYDKRDHAEIVALRQAGALARGATAYVTLEPCSHQGRTGPCVEALLAAGVRRVVIATADPNPAVNGSGIRRLREAGVEVHIGLLQEQARRLNDGFAKYIRTSLPLVVMKIAATLDGRIADGRIADGRIAPPSSMSPSPHWITGEEARAEVQMLRHSADALLTGVGTILADNPLLTDRSALPRRRPLLRVVLDSNLRLPLESQLVATAKEDVLVFFTAATLAAQQALQARGVRVERLKKEEEGTRVSLQQAVERLGEMQVTGVLVEGGAQVNAAMLNQNFVDKLILFYAPTFLGTGAVPMLGTTTTLEPIQDFSLRKLGRDFALEACLRDPWAGVS